MEYIGIDIEGMSCAHCVAAVTRALEGVEGVEVEQVRVGSATLAYDPARVRPERIVEAVENEGYQVTGRREQS